MLHLPNVTLLCADCVDVERAGSAIDRSTKYVSFGGVKLLTSLPSTRGDVVAIQRLASLNEYSSFMLRKSYRHIDTSHVLVVQHDGYVLDPSAWTDEFMDYDYTGAPWADGSVGNGGFSLRSRALMARVALMINEAPMQRANEDEVICLDLRERLEADGFRFAPQKLAARFSFELNEDLRPQRTFGFHFHKRAE